MSYFNNANNVTIYGGNFAPLARFGIGKLLGAANPSAMHNSSSRYNPPRCHPGTREAVLERIMQWIYGSKERETLILWLYGPAGAGKTAILQSIAEKCATLDILLASFFFSRSDDTRNHPDSLIATIVYQISTTIAQITPALDDAIARDPMIFQKTLETQIDLLIVGPLRVLLESHYFTHPMSPRLILIDGLNECSQQDQHQAVLHAIAHAIQVHKLPFIFLVSSRPETNIRSSFNSQNLVNLWSSLVLDGDYEAHEDVRIFLTASLRSIKETHPLKRHIPLHWPTSSDVNILVTKSSGQFIYASTVITYISAVWASPPQRLNVILGVHPARKGDVPFAELDALYMHILSSAQDTQLMLNILALLLGYFDFQKYFSVEDISWFLDVDQEDVDRTLSSLASITNTNRNNNDSAVYLSPASLSDFLADHSRSGNFYIDRAQYSANFLHQGIKQIYSSRGVSIPLFDKIFTSPRPRQMTENLYQDLKFLPLNLIWIELQRMGKFSKVKQNRRWLKMFEWLLPETKFVPADICNEVDLKYQRLCVRYAVRLKRLIKHSHDHAIKIKNYPALAETVAHDFVINGMCYSEALTNAINQEEYRRCWMINKFYFSFPCHIYRIIGLSHVNKGVNPYLHTALQILKSLETPPDALLARPLVHHYCHFHRNQWWNVVRSPRLGSLQAPCQHRKDHIRSGRVYGIQREKRLMNFQNGMCFSYSQNTLSRLAAKRWNLELIFKFLVPVLDQCPQSDKLLALLNQRIRDVYLTYTHRRRFIDAVYRYARRTSSVKKR